MHRGAEGLEAELLLAAPLHADAMVRYLHRDHRRIHRDIVGAVVPIAAGAVPMAHGDRVLRNTQHIRQRSAQRIDALGVRPHRQMPIAVFRQRTRRCHRGVRHIGTRIACRHHVRHCARRQRISQYPIIGSLTDQPLRFLLRRRDLGHVVPLRMQRRCGGGTLHHSFITADERDEIAHPHDAEFAAFRPSQRGLVQRREMRAATWLTQDARVQHVRPCHVMDEGGAGHLRRQVAPRQRLADITIGRVRLRRRIPLDVAREVLGRGKVPVVMPGRRITAAEDAILHRQFSRTAVQPLRQPIQHPRTQFRRHKLHGAAGYLDRLAARGLTFVRCFLGIT